MASLSTLSGNFGTFAMVSHSALQCDMPPGFRNSRYPPSCDGFKYDVVGNGV